MTFFRKYEILFVGVLVLLSAALSSYRLSESPPVWFDEGIFTQVAENLARYRMPLLQLAPANFIHAGSVASVGYPLLYPAAASMYFLGYNVFAARVPMVFWIIFLVIAAYYLIRDLFGYEAALWSSFLLASFAPLYGNGKSLLGEVPGLALLIFFAWCWCKSNAAHPRGVNFMFLAGFTAGLCFVTKPLFILIVPAIFVAGVVDFWRGKRLPPLRRLVIFCFAAALPIIFWLFTNFSVHNNIADILTWYLNPYKISDLGKIVIDNLQRFFSETTPLYFIMATAIWSAALFLRLHKKDDNDVVSVSFIELMLFIFVLLVGIFYLRTLGWYRYFFPGHVVALIFLPPALFWLIERYAGNFLKRHRDFGFLALRFALLAVVAFQFYQVGSASFVARSYNSNNSAELARYFRELPAGQTVFLYSVPETEIFIADKERFYQYFSPRPGVELGRENLVLLTSGVIDKIITYSGLADDLRRKFPLYAKSFRIGHYVVFERGEH